MLFEFFRKIACPFDQIEKYVPKRGQILDVGCGHGIFSLMLAQKSLHRKVLGIDPSPYKIKLAQKKITGLSNLKFQQAYLEEISGKFDCICIVDMLYLLSDSEKIKMLESCKKILKDNGVLILKEVEKKPGWLFKLVLLEETVMVNLLRYTHSDNLSLHFIDRFKYRELFKNVRLKIVVEKYLTSILPYPHILFVISKS